MYNRLARVCLALHFACCDIRKKASYTHQLLEAVWQKVMECVDSHTASTLLAGGDEAS